MNPDQELTDYERITVVGAGVTGQAVAEVLTRENKEVFVTDSGKINDEIQDKFTKNQVEFEENEHTEKSLETELVVVSPGVPLENPVIQGARSKGIPVVGEIELAYWLSRTKKIVAVTGTNGKTTTVNLITAILDHKGKPALACGNIGTPFVKIAPSLTSADIPVVEVSSYQLQSIVNFKPKVAILLNLTSDHIERHGSFEKYREAKLRIFCNQDENDYAIVNRKFEYGVPNKKPELIRFNRKSFPGVNLLAHQQENLGAAVEAINCITEGEKVSRLPPSVVKQGFEISHRLETIAEIETRKFINDSKATNPAATIAAINGFKEPIRLLLGGQSKMADYESLIRTIENSSVVSVYLFGAARGKIEGIMNEMEFENYFLFSSLKEATEKAFRKSRPGETIMLSPACSSFDQFDDYKQRGREFVRTVEAL
ncbi:MAG: UDP-N-acetylmuramoyl-L-alanine--D-glutamate ligase [Candidatus Bipolaricaulota bacterium]